MAERVSDPSLQEIKQRCLEIRKSWSEHTEEKRSCYSKPDAVVARCYVIESTLDGTIYLRGLQ